MSKGWIMLHRQLLENPIIRKPQYCHLWITLLLKAAHTKSEFIWNNRKHTLLAGQLMTGRKALSRETGIHESTVTRTLDYLESEQQIEQQTFTKFRVITIKNWDKYQHPQRNEQQANSRRTTSEQQANTYNNVNNGNNDNKYSPNSDEFRLAELLFNEIVNRKPDFRKPNLWKWAVHIDRMLRLDSRTIDSIEKVIRWCQRNDFWQNNILSTEKLRKHFDKLELQMEGKNNGKSKTYRTDIEYKSATKADGCIEI
jgi:DNA-binding transcriptional regulator YhcF (GntR family)